MKGDVYERLRASLARLDDKLAAGATSHVDPVILRDRTRRIAREPPRLTRAPDTLMCMVLERSGRRYAVPLEQLEEVGPMSAVAPVPGTPPAFLGVAARRGRVIAVVDLPVLFTGRAAAEPGPAPKWLVVAAHREALCAVVADDVHSIIDVEVDRLTRAMPTFPELVQRHTLGVLEDRCVVLALGDLLADRALRVEDRG
jgi:purine-binding chemotaxis protein CheW